MTETQEYIGFGDVDKFLVKSYKRITGGREFDIDKYGPYVDAVRHVLVPNLEKQILFFLERFVYNENDQHSSYQPYLNRYKESMLTAYAKYNEIGNSIDAIRDLITIDYLVDFFGHSLLTTTRLAKLGDDLDRMGIEKNFLGYLNVLNYINEKDFWVCATSSGNTSRQYSSVCSYSNDKILSDASAERGSHVVVSLRGHKRPRKRAATHISRKHYKLERLAQFSEKSFRVTESLYDLLKSSWDLHDSLQTKRRLKRNWDSSRRSSFVNYRRRHRKNEWKNENLTLFIKVMNSAGTKVDESKDQRNSEVRTSLSLPCRLEQLISKLEGVDPPSSKSHCTFIETKFQTKLYNVCSCLNNLLSRMDDGMINSIYLLCEIRKDYLNFKLKQTPASKYNSYLFSARVMTREGLNRYRIRKNGSRQKLKSQNSWALKKANELSNENAAFGVSENLGQDENEDFAKDEVISSIEISFTICEDSAKDKQNWAKGLACDPEDFEGLMLGDSLSISDLVKKLELSPFRLEETEQSFRTRSKIREIVRSIMVCTRENNSLPVKEDRPSISIQVTVSTSSFPGTKHDPEVLSIEPKKASSIEPKTFSSRSRESRDCNECLKKSNEPVEPKEYTKPTEKFVIPRSCPEVEEQGFKSRGSVRADKSLKKFQTSSSSGESPKLTNKNKYKICTSSEKPTRYQEFTGSHRRPLSKKMAETTASGISNALVRNKSTSSAMAEDENDFDIDVIVEIEDSSESSDSISRHTHLLPSMKSVKLGTRSKYFGQDSGKSPPSSSSSLFSGAEILVNENFTTMNKSMISSSQRGTISDKSYDRIKHLIREKVCKKFSETDSVQPNSSKTIVSSGKYYLSIPSSKTSRVRLRREISESSSTSRDSRNPRRRIRKTSSSDADDESDFGKSSNAYHADSENYTESSRAATFDKRSTYGCVEDRLANRHFSEIIDDYSDEAGDSPRTNQVECRTLYERFCNDGMKRMDKYYDGEVSSEENETSFSQELTSVDDEHANVTRQCGPEKKWFTTYIAGRGIVQDTPELEDYGRTRRASGWSTCAVRSSSSADCPGTIDPLKSDYRLNIRDRGDSPRHKTSGFGRLNIIEKYKKRFRNIDKSLRAKLLQYVDFWKNVKSNLQKQICLDDVYDASGTSITSNDFRRQKYTGVYFSG